MLDLGCGFAQDVRQVLVDGCPVENVYGVDLEAQFIDLGFELFLDEDRTSGLRERFLVADILSTDGKSALDGLDGGIEIVNASQFFHLFGWASQVKIGKRLVRLTAKRKGCLIVGYQCGLSEAREILDTPTKDGKQYMHSPESLQRLWDEIGVGTGSAWKVEAWMDRPPMWESYVATWAVIERISFAIKRTS